MRRPEPGQLRPTFRRRWHLQWQHGYESLHGGPHQLKSTKKGRKKRKKEDSKTVSAGCAPAIEEPVGNLPTVRRVAVSYTHLTLPTNREV